MPPWWLADDPLVVTQSVAPSKASARGAFSTAVVPVTVLPLGSIRVSSFASASATQMLPPPAASWPGEPPVCTLPVTSFEDGSIFMTVPLWPFATHTSVPSKVIPLGPWPTAIV